MCHLIIVLLLFSCKKGDTNNNGSNQKWTKSSTAVSKGLNDLHFYKQYGIIACDFGTILKTKDGGNSWTTSYVPVNHSLSVAFTVSEKDRFVGRLGLYKSSNSGASFSEIGNTSSFGSSIFGIHFTDSLSGIISKGGSIYGTSDGGLSWVNTYNQYGYASILNYTSGGTYYLLGGTTFDGKSIAEVHKSRDYGKTWTQLKLPIELEQSQILSSCFNSDINGFVVTLNNKLFETKDGGNSWTKVANLDFSIVKKLLFINFKTAFCIAGNSIYKSTDSGKNWTLDYKASNDVILTDLESNYTNSLFVTDNEGNIYRNHTNLLFQLAY